VLKALDRNIATASDRIVFVAPSATAVSDTFHRVDVDEHRHQRFVRDVQRMRGSIYLKDGALQPHQLTSDGRHQTPEDETSWHMLLLDKHQRVTACALYLEHDHNDVTFDRLRARHCPLTNEPEWRPTVERAIEAELDRARSEQLHYVELGGWAVSEESRGTAGPLALALAVYGFSRRAGGALGITTATFRHCSATILKRLGGSRFEVDGVTLPPYYDSRYQCMMEMLKFDSRQPNPKYVSLIDQVRDTLARITVVARPAASIAEESSPYRFFTPMSHAFERPALAS
jgi:hypothetical protein